MPEPNPAVAAILAVTPVDSRGLVVGCYDEDDRPHVHIEGHLIAADQAAAARRAILRELADELDAKADAVSANPRYRPRLYLDAPRLRQLADEIEASTSKETDR